MGDHDDGASVFLVQFVEQFHDFGSHLGVQVTGRLVGKDDVGVADDGTGDGDTLTLAARELRREVAHAVREADLFEHGDGGFTAFLGADLTVKKGQFDIIEYVQRIDQMERLEDET